MPSDAQLPVGTIIAGRYRVLRTAGSGGMGVVYVVEHLNTGGRGALKIMRSGKVSERTVERFRREARASAIIQSEHVVRVTDADVAHDLDDAPFLVMELLEGEDLADRLAEHGRLNARETVDILSQVARGLERAHAAGVVHRDLKPHNIFLHRRDDGSMVVKLVDFGISRIQRESDGREVTGLTRTDDVFGTPGWMAPEQAMSMHHAIGPATDTFAVGLLAFRMLSGDSYWGDRDAPKILTALTSPDRATPSELDPRLTADFDRWFLKSCKREPERRYKSAIEQTTELARALGIEAPRMASQPFAEAAIEDEVTSRFGAGPPSDQATPPTGGLEGGLERGETTEPTGNLELGTGDIEAVDVPPRPLPERSTTAPLRPAFEAVAKTQPLRQALSRGVPAPPLLPPMQRPTPIAPRPAWVGQLVWIVPGLVFGLLLVGFVAWAALGDDPAPSRSRPKPEPPASASVAEPEPEPEPAPTPTLIEEPAPATEPAPLPVRPPKSKPRPRRDAFDTQK